MRRILLSLVALSSAALLAACSQGGSAFYNNVQKADRVIVTANGDGQSSGVAKVLPGSQINLAAQAVNSPNNSVSPSGSYSWTVLAVNGGTYTNGGGTVTNCPVPVAGVGANGLTTSVYTNSSTGNNLTITAPAASSQFAGATPTAAYCLVATATYLPTGAVGSIPILVSTLP